MSGTERRNEILKLISESSEPVSGSKLAKLLSVSRQVVVQDIALLRAVNKNILSTNKGYVIYQEEEAADQLIRKTIHVQHTDDEILDELCTIVDYGGKVIDVVVEHEIYGQITCDLIITSRLDAKTFINQCQESQAKGLGTLTDGNHYHTIETTSQQAMDEIEGALLKKGYLIKEEE